MVDGDFVRIEQSQLAHSADPAVGSTTVLLATALMNVQVGLVMHRCRALCDSGAQMNLISSACAKRIGAKLLPYDQLIIGIGNNDGTSVSNRAILDVRAHHNNQFVLTAEFVVMTEMMGKLPRAELASAKVPPELVIADPHYNIPADVDLLFGAGIWAKIMNANIYRSPIGTILQETELGHLILGRYELQADDIYFLSSFHTVSQMQEPQMQAGPSLEEINQTLKRFWEMQELSEKRIRSPQEALVEKMFVETHYRQADGRYVVKIPIVPGAGSLGDSRAIAVKRFLWLERRLQRDSELRVRYVEFMREYEQLGHMKLVTEQPQPGELVFYIPHHPVM